MSPLVPQVGAYPLTGVAKLPNADVASPGEVWTNRRASGVIIPGSCVRPTSVGGKLAAVPVAAGDTIDARQLAVGLRQIAVPDLNPGSLYNPALGPNEIVNLAIADQDWVRTVHTGEMHLTLVIPDGGGYTPGELIAWHPDGARPAGKAAGTGAWGHASGHKAGTDIFEAINWRPYGSAGEGVLTVRFLRSNQ